MSAQEEIKRLTAPDIRAGAALVVAALLAEPFGNWHVDTATQTHQLRVTKKGDAVVHTLSYQMARHFNAPVRGAGGIPVSSKCASARAFAAVPVGTRKTATSR